MTTSTPARPGAAELGVTFRLATGAWIVMAVQEAFLFLRPTPYGGPYVQEVGHYFWLAVCYDLLAAALISLPFACYWLLRRSPAPVGPGWHRFQLALLVLTVGLDHADNELMRFLGTHLSASLLQTYARVGAWGSDMRHIFATDRGGPWLPFLLLGFGMGVLWWRGSRVIAGWPRRPWSPRAALAVTVLPVLVPGVIYSIPGGRFPRARVRPAVFRLVSDLLRGARTGAPLAEAGRIAAETQRAWRAGTADSLWRFPDSTYPLFRQPEAADSGTSSRWNFIFLQLETFRGWNTGFLGGDGAPSATPFLDSLASSPGSAWWSRALSFGPPTPNGFFSGHCSAPPHSRQFISTGFTTTRFACLPALLRRHGYRTAYLTGSDPDWDNQSIWLRQWYDTAEYYRDADELDRLVFRRAAARILDLGRGGAPFLATVVSISNHYPFRSRERRLDIAPETVPGEAVRNTMHYTDDVVRELVETLRQEPWFSRTVLVIVGDHGYNLGEHDGTAGQRNGWRESTWVPLLVHGPDPRIPPGRHDDPASLLDVAPTIADLAGIRDPVPWVGRSLLAPAAPGALVTLASKDATFAETARWSMVRDDATGIAHLYDPLADPLQRRDLAAEYPDTAAALLRLARERQALWDYLVETNRVTPPGPAAEAAP